MATDPKIHLCYPCGFFRPGDADDPIAGEYRNVNGAVWPNTAGLFWEKLRSVEKSTVTARSGGTLAENGSIHITCLNEVWRVDAEAETVVRVKGKRAEVRSDWDRQLPFLILVYLVSARDEPATHDMVLPRDLFKGFDLFRNSLDPEMRRVEQTFGRDGEAFLRAAARLGGKSIHGGDVAARFHVLPKFPVDYILWLGDSEFPASLTLLVDRSTPLHLPGDAIGVVLSLLSRRLCEAVKVPQADPTSLTRSTP